MGVKIMSKVKEKSKSSVAVSEVAQAIERIAEIDAQMEGLGISKLEMERAKLVEKLQFAVENAPEDEAVVLEGVAHNAVFTEKALQRKIADMKEVRKALGNETFMKIARVTLGDMDKYLSEQEREPLLEITRSGARRLKIVEKE